MVKVAGAVLARRAQHRSGKRPAALALAAAGAAGIALAKRRRSGAANEPPEEVFQGGEQATGPQAAGATVPVADAQQGTSAG